nr:hypothetical protein CCACVL1_30839 [Ipomoea batatas]
MLGGSSPVRKLLSRYKNSRFVHNPSSKGILPEKLLLSKDKEVNCAQLPMRCGTNSPESLLEDKSNSTSLERLDMLGGNSPGIVELKRLLYERRRNLRLDKLVRLMGRGPWKKLLPRSRCSRFCSLENTGTGICEVISTEVDMRQQRHSMEFRPIWSFQIIHSQIQVPQVLKVANFKRNHILEKVSETTKVPELCQLPNLYWYCPSEVVIAQVQKNELKEAADSRWDHSAQTIVIEIDANQECSKEVDGDMPLIFHFKRASASSLFACPLGSVGHPSAGAGPFGIQSSGTEPISRRILHEAVGPGAGAPSRHEHMKKFGETNGRAMDGLV